jgi:hypothetical protein
VPGILRVVRPYVIGALNGIMQGVLEDFPGHFLAGFTQGTSVNGFATRSQTAPAGITEKVSTVNIDAVVIAISYQ